MDFAPAVLSPLAWFGYVFILGAIVGSFLNVYIYRFHTRRSLQGSSHCLSCGERLRAYDLVPILSYLWLRGRCRVCGSIFSPRYLFVEIATGVGFVLAAGAATTISELFLLWFLLAVLTVIFVYDIRHFIIPDALTATTLLTVVVLTAPLGIDAGVWIAYGIDIFAALSGAFFLFVLWFISKGTWLGFGDVKLAVPLGLLVGAELVFSFIVLSFWVGAGISLILLGLTKLERGQLTLPFLPRGLTIKSVVPFAPFLILGCLIVYFTRLNVLTFFTL